MNDSNISTYRDLVNTRKVNDQFREGMMVFKILFGIFLFLHGLVHMLYVGQSARKFKLQPELTWPDESWVFSRFLPIFRVRILTNFLLTIATVGFLMSAFALLANLNWFQIALTITAIYSSLVYVLNWDAKFKGMDHQGFVGILINMTVVILAYLFI